MMKNAEEEDRENRRKQIDAVAMAIGWKDRRTHTHPARHTTRGKDPFSCLSLFVLSSFLHSRACVCMSTYESKRQLAYGLVSSPSPSLSSRR